MQISKTTCAALALGGFVALGAACTDSAGPSQRQSSSPRFATVAAPAAGSAITLDQVNGTLAERGRVLVKGFNPTNPHRGDAIVATFFWRGPATIDSVGDVLTDLNFTRVGNSYAPVTQTSAGGYSMATYVATNVQNFPDPNTDPGQGDILAVRAYMSDSVPEGGVTITAWSGVNLVASYALGAHQSAAGTSASGIVPLGPGSIAIGDGALAYGVTMASPPAGRDPPAGYTRVGVGSDAEIVNEADFLMQSGVGTTNPQWDWFFGSPSSWLSSVIALNPPLHLAFAVQPSTTLPLVAIQPPVQIAVVDAMGNRVTGFGGSVTIAIGHNGGTVMPGTLSGTKTVPVVNGVATFSDLSIDQPGTGYTLIATVPNVVSAESAPFNIGAF